MSSHCFVLTPILQISVMARMNIEEVDLCDEVAAEACIKIHTIIL